MYACDLLSDLSLLPFGDATSVGPGGALLSGGQRKRIAIARCLYSKAEVTVMVRNKTHHYLFSRMIFATDVYNQSYRSVFTKDRPLKSLDSEVASNIVNRGILQLLRKRKRTLVIATESPFLIRHADSLLNVSQNSQSLVNNLTGVF